MSLGHVCDRSCVLWGISLMAGDAEVPFTVSTQGGEIGGAEGAQGGKVASHSPAF